MSHRHVLPAFLVLALSVPVSAQNLVTNGDFSKVDTNGNPTGWTVQKFDFKPAVVKFDTAGFGADNAFSANHGKRSTTSSGVGELSQGVGLIVQSLTYELRADVAVGGGFNNDPGKFEFFVDGVSVAVMDFTNARGSKPGNATFRERVCVRFTATKTTAAAQLKVAISRRFLALPGRTPKAYLDNVFLAQVEGPVLCVRGERKAGSSVDLSVSGRASTDFAFFASTGLLPTPVTIPGWTGKLELSSPLLLLFTGKTDTSGRFSVKVTTPGGAASIYLQGAHTGGTNVALGNAQRINLY